MNMSTPNLRYQNRPGLERAERTSPFQLQCDYSAAALGRKKKITVDFDGDITAKKEFLVSDGTHLELHLRAFAEFMKEMTDWGLEDNGEWLFKIFRQILEVPATQNWDLVLASPDFDGQPLTVGLFTDAHRQFLVNR